MRRLEALRVIGASAKALDRRANTDPPTTMIGERMSDRPEAALKAP